MQIASLKSITETDLRIEGSILNVYVDFNGLESDNATWHRERLTGGYDNEYEYEYM